MNCNSNTAPLPNVSTGQGCNVGCVPKPINVVCRQIIIPSGQEILAVEGDMNSSYREFLIPLDTDKGVKTKWQKRNILMMMVYLICG
jgi:hypothetical protein